jgi:hypothetical protein
MTTSNLLGQVRRFAWDLTKLAMIVVVGIIVITFILS